MVSLNERLKLAALTESDPQLKRLQFLLSGENLVIEDSSEGGVSKELLLAISSKDSGRFKEVAIKIGQRKISANSDWCQDDYLLFLLLFGNEIFGRPLTFLSRVIEARRNNPNPIPQKINEVFSALERQEFGIDGEFCFLKIPFLRLTGKLRLGPSDAVRALKAISVPGLTDQMSPFLQLLTLTAYDLILTERQPLATETAMQLIDGFEVHAKNLSMRQWLRVVSALPGRMIWAIITLVAGAGLFTVLMGAGKELVESRKSKEVRTRPTAIAVAGIHDVDSDFPTEALLLARTLSRHSNDPGKRSLMITVAGAPFTTATPSFIVEVSHPEKPIQNAFVFTQAVTEGVRPFTVVPVQRDAGRFRAIIPEQPIGQRLCFVLEFEADANDSIQSVGRRIILRSLQ